MRRLTIWIGGIAVAALCAGVLVYPAIEDTKHDLSSGSTSITDKSTDEDQICVFCHTPHDALASSQPLWNHTLSGSPGYQMYDSTVSNTIDAAVTNLDGGTGVSNMCLSCHDGTVGVNSLVNPPNDLGGSNPTMGNGTEFDATGKMIRTPFLLGTDLRNDHPINFPYNATLITDDGELNAAADFPNSVDAAGKVKLFGSTGTVQCASCHDPHDNTIPAFLSLSNAASGLCLTCHNK